MDFQLLVIRGRSASEALKLMDGVTTVGRHDDCQIRIKSSQVSRRHCEFFEKKGLLLVKDLGSANGTIVNGKKIQGQQVLEPGDELTIGQVKLVVARIGETPAPRTPAPAAAPAAGDTAVVEAIVVDDGVNENDNEEFEIDFDDLATSAVVADEPQPAPAKPAPVETPASAPPPAPAPPPAAAKKAEEPPPAPAPELPEATAADDAIADFLLDIKIDED